jgi:hypothetical protein
VLALEWVKIDFRGNQRLTNMFSAMPARILFASVALAGFALSGCTTDNFVTAPGSVRTGFQPEVKPVPYRSG